MMNGECGAALGRKRHGRGPRHDAMMSEDVRVRARPQADDGQKATETRWRDLQRGGPARQQQCRVNGGEQVAAKERRWGVPNV
jgi:hypothetical protein